MSDDARAEALQTAVQAALLDNAGAAEPWDQGIVTTFVLVAEVMGGDGEMYLRYFGTPDSPTWRDLGLLRATLLDIERTMNAMHVGNDADDEDDD